MAVRAALIVCIKGPYLVQRLPDQFDIVALLQAGTEVDSLALEIFSHLLDAHLSGI
jgi:hypothetical protein